MSFVNYSDSVNARIKSGMAENVKRAVLVFHGAVVKRFTGGRGGRMYRKPGGVQMYQASAPGESPASASGTLRGSVDFDVNGLSGRVGTPKKYGLYLEEGTKVGGVERMAARPFISAAEKDVSDRIQKELGRKIE
jgi:phage gpG-like protein